MVTISMLDGRSCLTEVSDLSVCVCVCVLCVCVLRHPDRILGPSVSQNFGIWFFLSGTKRPESKTNPTHRYRVLSVRTA
jgi:hypothetical protein